MENQEKKPRESPDNLDADASVEYLTSRFGAAIGAFLLGGFGFVFSAGYPISSLATPFDYFVQGVMNAICLGAFGAMVGVVVGGLFGVVVDAIIRFAFGTD